MVKDSIKIYARLKQENPAKTATYEVLRTANSETITFRFNHVGDFVNNRPQTHRFRKVSADEILTELQVSIGFEKVFDQFSTQSEVFDLIAKPVVDSVLQGFNGTIFAYGQTGSGKTYAITGSSEDYQGRGIIPRSIEEIFDCINKAPDKYTIYISYLEIYNEIGYDLLNPKQQVSSLEELPLLDVAKYRYKRNYYQILRSKSRKVILLEDGKGESHLRNLSVQKVSSEQEAMRLLFLGDTNRTITETPMNVYSSRSHCIFTICVTSRNTKSGKIRRSKLNLVDLAGSERINKSNISGTTLNEAKYINLSLHYLEQVILALSQKRSHVPFRNSMLTYMLRDSLSGNCKTVLLATIAVNRKNIEETIATCKFAQRVAEVNMEAVINEEIDPQQEIEYLKNEVESLRKQLMYQSRFRISGKLTKEEKENWRNVINNYLRDSKDEPPLTNFDTRHIQYCFKLLKEAVKEREEQKLKLKLAEDKNKELIEQYKRIIKEKDEEISTLKSLLYNDTKSPSKNLDQSLDMDFLERTNANSPLDQGKENVPPLFDPLTFSTAQKVAFEIFLKDSKNTSELDQYKQSIQNVYEVAKRLTFVVEQCQNKILTLRAKLPCENRVASVEIDLELLNQQSIYRNSLAKLQELKKETGELSQGLERSKMNLLDRFKQWYESVTNDDNKTERNPETLSFSNKIRNLYSKGSPTTSGGKNFLRNNSENLCKEGGDNYFQETCKNQHKSRSRSPSELEGDKSEDFWKEIADVSFSKPKTDYGRKQRSRSRPRSPFSSINHKFEDFLKTSADESCDKFMESCFQKEDASENEYKYHRRNKSKNSQGPTEYKCKVLWKQSKEDSGIKPNERNEEVDEDKNQDRSRSNGPKKPQNFDQDFSLIYNSRTISPKSSFRKNNNFSLVYQDIMGYNDSFSDNVQQLISERPYSSESEKIVLTADNRHLKAQIDEKQVIMQLGKNLPSDKHWSSHYTNYSQAIKNKYAKLLKGNEERDVSEEEEEEEVEIESSLGTSNSSEEKSVFGERKPANVYEQGDYKLRSQIGVKIWDKKNWSVSSGNGEDKYNFKTACNQRLPGCQTPNTVNQAYCNKHENVLHVTENENARKDFINNSTTDYSKNDNSLFLPGDSPEFRNFIKTIPLTGDAEVDEEIIKFYRTKFVCS